MTYRYFLGANTKDGFRSLYDGLPPGDEDRLHILKGGPGTGKSSFLRAIASSAEARGLEVEQVLCSGDPDSLDGVYVPALHRAWVDGTAPHVIEPRIFGASGDYVHIGAFCTVPFSTVERKALSALTHAYRERYDRAYRALALCGDRDDWLCEGPTDAQALERLAPIPGRGAGLGTCRRLWLRAVCCQGLVQLNDCLEGLSQIPVAPDVLIQLADSAAEKGLDRIVCPSPIDPDLPEALLLPGGGLAFTALTQPSPKIQDRFRQALDALREAKALHDELEAIYGTHMDFGALSAFTAEQLQRIFA
ncbi:MAG: hypothetical protein IK095_02880 [Oscillospiraceae bacterium]|nr:hypothetical protein [Oscillospiraceae bacterium]